MVLTRLVVKRFKQFKDLAIDLVPGFNLIRGPNESGKSTLRAALMAALFGNPTSQSEMLEQWVTWGERERPEFFLDYLDRQGRACRLHKDFAEQKLFLTVGDEPPYKSRTKIQELIAEDLGIPSEEFYKACASLDVRSLFDLGDAARRRQLGERLAGKMTGADAGDGIFTTIKRLKENLAELQRGLHSPAKTCGPILDCRNQLGQLKTQQAEVQRGLAARRQNLAKAAELEAQILRQQEELGALDAVLEANRKLSAAEKRRGELAAQDHQFEQTAQQRRTWQAELAQVEAELARQPAAVLTGQDIERLQTLVAAQQKLGAEGSPSGAGPKPSWALVALGAGLTALGLLLLLLAGGSGWWWLLAGLGTAAVGFWQRQAQREKFAAAAAAVQARSAEADKVARELAALVERAGAQSADEVLKAWPLARELGVKRDGLTRNLATAAAGDEAAWRAVRQELRLTQDLLADAALAPKKLSPVEFARRERERTHLAASLEDLKNQRGRLQGLLDHETADADQAAAIEERIALLEERAATLDMRARVGRLAVEWLEQARRASISPQREVLESEACRFLAVFSGGHYQRLSVAEDDLSCQVYLPETHAWADPVVLSQGAQDQLYLSLRLALVGILAAGRKPPLLLDEPLAAFDRAREEQTLRLFKEVARQQQILFFTCREHYDKFADRVIVLE